MWWTAVRGCWYDGWQFSVCLLLWCRVLFKSAFRLKIHQNDLFFRFFFFLTSAHQNYRKTLKEHQFVVFSSQMHFWNAKTTTSSMNAGLLIHFAIRQNPHMKDLCSCLDIWTMFFCTAGIKVLVEHRCWYGRNLLFIPVLLCFSFIMRVVIWLEKEASPFAF